MKEPKVWHQCEKGVLRPYISLVCSLCKTRKEEDDHFVKVAHLREAQATITRLEGEKAEMRGMLEYLWDNKYLRSINADYEVRLSDEVCEKIQDFLPSTPSTKFVTVRREDLGIIMTNAWDNMNRTKRFLDAYNRLKAALEG